MCEIEAKMSSKKAHNQAQHNEKLVGANSCFISWFVFLTFVLSLLLVSLDSSVYSVSYLANISVFRVNNNSTPNINLVKTEGTTISTNETVNQYAESSDECAGKYIYMQDLPSQFNDDLLKNCSSLNVWVDMCKYFENYGLGPRLNESDHKVFSDAGWFNTNQFSLEVIFHNRMKHYRCLTNNSSVASAVYVPFYAGLDVGRYLWNPEAKKKDAASLQLVKYLKQKPEWQKIGGRDHFLVVGRISWDFRREIDRGSDWGNCLFSLPEVKNMTNLVIESSPWSNTDFAIPYPTYFHPSSDSEVYSWQKRMRKQKRPYLFSFAGAPRPQLKDSIRNDIINQCISTKSKHCKFVKCDAASRNCGKPRILMKLFQSSVFCLQPPGDSYTRRSAFDSILAGCIPVFFHPASAYVQYLWHLPKNYTRYSVLIPMEDVKKGNFSIEKRLLELPKEEVKAMREEVINLIPRVVYANPNPRLETVEDAFDMSIKEVLKRVKKIRMEVVEGKNLTSESVPEEFSWKYNFFGGLENHEWDSFFTRT